MSELKHTPGPWYWREANHSETYADAHSRTLVSSGQQSIQKSNGRPYDKPILVPMAAMRSRDADRLAGIHLEIHGSSENERLVAAAPDLLEACERVLRAIEWSTTEDRMTQDEQADYLAAAIDKAEGE